VETYTAEGRRYLRHCQQHALAPLEPAALRHWRQTMVDESQLSPHTINVRLCAVKALVQATARMGKLGKDIAYEFALIEKVQIAALRAIGSAPTAAPSSPRSRCAPSAGPPIPGPIAACATGPSC
jgi:hypothetical protein